MEEYRICYKWLQKNNYSMLQFVKILKTNLYIWIIFLEQF